MHLLLDTNILINLISDPRQEYVIKVLQQLIDSGQIKLLVPDVLLKEWTKKKLQTLDYITRRFSSSKAHSHNRSLNFEDDISIIKEKIQKVDTLLSTGISIPLIRLVKVMAVDRGLNNQAPFHGDKKKSTNDALFYFSAIYYIEKKNFKEFAFATNDTDFVNPTNRNELHPDLLPPSAKIYFSPAVEKLLLDLQDSGRINFERKFVETGNKYIIYVASHEKKTVLDYLYEVLTLCYEKMRFIPPDIFCKIHPFRTQNVRYNYSYYSNYVLYTNNEELINFLAKIDIDRNKFKKGSGYRNTKLNISKISKILDLLNRQLVFTISNIDGNHEVKIRPKIIIDCNCVRCLYTKLKFIDSLNSEDTSDILKTAFVQFQFGFYTKSLQSYYECYLRAKENGNKVLAYQLQFILKWVNNHVNLNTEDTKTDASQQIDRLDNETEYFSFANSPALDREIASFFHSGNIIRAFAGDIKESRDKIREHYTSQLRASYSNNSNCWNLICGFSIFEEFTLANGMAYTQYSDFSNICDDYVEGIMLGLALNEYQPSRLLFFNDYILRTLLNYGNPDKMIVLYKRYVKKEIPYVQEDGSFMQRVTNLLNNDKDFINYLEQTNAWHGSQHFYNRYWNLLLLLSIVDIDTSFIMNCFDKIVQFLDVIPKRETTRLNHLATFIHSKGKHIDQKQIKQLFNQCLENPLLHSQEVFEAFAGLSRKSGPSFIDDRNEFDKFCQLFLNKTERTVWYSNDILLTIHSSLTEEFKTELTVLIHKKLQDKFDHEVYYLASLYEVIDYRANFDQYLALFKHPVQGRRHPFGHLDGELSYRELNNLMNLVFKNKISLPISFIENLKGISDYYDWLLDMDNFDYRMFKQLWIIQYATLHYLEKIFAYDSVRQKVRHYLKKNHQPTLAAYYSQYVK